MTTDVATIIANQQAYATDAIASANTVLEDLTDMASASYFSSQSNALIPDPGFEFDSTEEMQALLLGLFPSDLAVADITATAPDFTPTEIAPLADVPVPDFSKVAPTLEIPQTPSSALPTAPGAPSISDPVLPSAPVVVLPSTPTLAGISFPDVPSVEIPAFVSAPQRIRVHGSSRMGNSCAWATSASSSRA